MDPQQNQTQQMVSHGEENHPHHHHGSKQQFVMSKQNNSSSSTGGGSSSRWTPTSEQVRILKELYYNNGVRSPTTEQIQRISARLRQYGKIEGKNVFYWFQNHKARERQKKRFGSGSSAAAAPNANPLHDHHHHHLPAVPMQRALCTDYNAIGNGVWKSEQEHSFHNFRCTNMGPAGYYAVGCAPAGVNGQVGNYAYGSPVTIEKHFRGCSLAPTGGSINIAGTWLSTDHSSKPYSFLGGKRETVAAQEQEDGEGEGVDDDEEDQGIINRTTLQLFPVHPSASDHHSCISSGPHRQPDCDFGGDSRSPYASLELSLSSYTRVSSD